MVSPRQIIEHTERGLATLQNRYEWNHVVRHSGAQLVRYGARIRNIRNHEPGQSGQDFHGVGEIRWIPKQPYRKTCPNLPPAN